MKKCSCSYIFMELTNSNGFLTREATSGKNFWSKISLKDCSTIAILDLDLKQKLTKYCGQPCKANPDKPSALCFIGNFLRHSEWLTVYINGESWKIMEIFLRSIYLVKLLNNSWQILVLKTSTVIREKVE